MLAKAIRAALFTGLMLALWTAARPARADVLAPDVLATHVLVPQVLVPDAPVPDVLVRKAVVRPLAPDTLAPFCDDRGATALAPPPALEPTDEALLRAAAPPADDGGPSFGASLVPARRVVKARTAELTPVLPSPAALSPAPISAFVVFEREALPQGGVRFRIERPPRG
jgi:hypothetical protein